MATRAESSDALASAEEIVPMLVEDSLSDLAGSGETATTTGDRTPENNLVASIMQPLCVSHFLSTWNSRVFEFGAVLFLAKIFPGTLLPSSLYALVRARATIGFSPIVGN